MPPDRWQQISQLYHAALTREESERTAFVREACAGDAALQREIESLLGQTSGAAGFLSTPAAAMAESLLNDSQPTMLPAADGLPEPPNDTSRLEPGQRFGPYRIERLLGGGGMGEVYEAEHLEHGRRIALKVLRQRLNDPQDRARFLREGRLAASVSHPHTVYIYSSEEIAGVPVIAMELLPGGTLKDRVVNQGPLAPTEAIDAMLQVVSGLEAAHAAGILHRDIKPSNCLIDADGTVKIGDFGLSISTRARDVSQLTVTGTAQGTPQFASPEQLRGQALDVRSDIYAVGATLYYLLTARPPFDDHDLMVLVSRISTEPPTSPRKVRPEIPGALTALVLQCLAKDPADRPASYRILSSVLESLGSTAKTPAPLGIRTAAGALDAFLVTFLLTLPVQFLAVPPSAFDIRHLVIHLVEVIYFAITESVWGASLAKALCGFRVVTERGARPPFERALFRALVFVLPGWLASGLFLLIAGRVYSQRSGPIIAVVVESTVAALLFVPARRRNGFAGIHEWVSHTRTVLNATFAVAPARRHFDCEPLREGPPVPAAGVIRSVPAGIEVAASARRVGPYRLVDASTSQQVGGAALGYDERLRRLVWLRFPEVGSEPVPFERQILGRPARSRWLSGQRTSGLAWDAYEHVPGQPFHRLVRQAQSWEIVREWVRNLAAEVCAGLRDGAPPDLELNRVWIGDDGRARVLDWSLCDDRQDSGGSSPSRAVDWPEAQRFLHRVAVSALDGRVLADDNSYGRAPRVPLPLPVVELLAKLGEQRFTTPDEMLTGVISAGRGATAVSRSKRAVHLVLCAILPIMVLSLGVYSASRQMVALPDQGTAKPDIAELAACLDLLEAMDNRGVPSTDRQHRALEVYIAGRHSDLIANPPIWSASLFAQRVISTERRTLAKRVVANLPISQKADVNEAARILRPFLDSVTSGVQSTHPYIVSVSDGEVGDRAGIKANDVVVTVDGEPITFASQLVAAIKRHPDHLITLSIVRDGQPLMIRATPARKANQGVLGIGIANETGPDINPRVVAWRYLWLHVIVGLMLAGTLGLLSALASRGGIALRLMSIAVVTKNGVRASGWRVRLRAVLSWLPVLGASVAVFAGHAPLLTLTPPATPLFAIIPSLPQVFLRDVPPIFFPSEPSILFVRVSIITVALVVFAVGAMYAVIRPERGLQDRLAGTWLVPR